MRNIYLSLADFYGHGGLDEVPYAVLRMTEWQVNDLFVFCARPPEGWGPDNDIQDNGTDDMNLALVRDRAEKGVLSMPGTFAGEVVCDFPLRKAEVDTMLKMEAMGSDSCFSDLMEGTRIS